MLTEMEKKHMIKQIPGKISPELRQSIADYLQRHYVQAPVHEVREVRELFSCYKRVAPCAPTSVAKAMSLEEMLKQEDAGFTQTLLHLIDDSGKKDSEIYKKANISKQHFSKIRNNPGYKPTKPTAIALALALELDLEQTKDLIGRAGYALTNSSKFDLIIRYFIEQKNYDLMQINLALYEFDQALLGS